MIEVLVKTEGERAPSAWDFWVSVAPHVPWLILACLIILLLGPKRIREMFARAEKIGVAGFEIDLKAQIDSATLAKNMEVNPSLRDQVTKRMKGASQLFQGARVLWVDDRPFGNEEEIRLLRSLGVQFSIAKSTAAAKQSLDISVFDLIITDMSRHKGSESGNETLELAKEALLQPHVIFYVGVERQTPNGAFGLTTRPDELFNLIIDVFERVR